MAITPSQWSHVLTIPENYTPSAATSGQTLVITESVIAKLSAPDQSAFWSNVQNGGGDVRICESIDGNNQLPIEVVSLDSVAQTCVIWTRKPTYDGTGDLYIFIGKAGETQPPVTDPFGRNAVWQDYEIRLGCEDLSVAEDSTGKRSYSDIGSVIRGVQGKFGNAYSLTDAGLSTSSPDYDFSNGYKISYWGNLADISKNGLFFIRMRNEFNISRNNGNEVILRHDGDFTFLDADAELFQTGSISFYEFKWNPADGVFTIRKDGQLLNTQTLSTFPTNRPTATLFIESSTSNSDWNTIESLSMSGYKDDNYSATEYANQNDPATFFGAPTLVTTGGGIVDYTIALDSGNYLLQGDTLALLSDRNLVIENGSYSLTRQELNLALQRSITLSQGIYSQQGTNVTLTVGRLLGMDTGSYFYLGEDINLQYGREFRLSLEQGAYSLQGSDVLLLKEHILTLEPNSYAYSADNISLLSNRIITTGSGDYSYSGSPINFIYEAGGITYTLSLESGGYNLTVDSLRLLTSRRLPIDFGTYTYEGVNSNLLYNRVVALDSGVYSSSGTDLGIKVNRRLVFDNGNYSLQGTPVTLSYSGEVLAILEGYNLSYKKHPIQSKYKTYNITARYN